jgi:hypothetical protein
VCGTRRNGGRWGWFFLGASPPCTAPPSYGRDDRSVACRRTIHVSTASDGDILDALARTHPSDKAHLTPHHARLFHVWTGLRSLNTSIRVVVSSGTGNR